MASWKTELICDLKELKKNQEDVKMKNQLSRRDERSVSPFNSYFDNIVRNFFENEGNYEPAILEKKMPIDMVEHEDKFELIANLPGIKKENVKISINENELVISATQDEKREEKKGAMYRSERYHGNYRRTIYLNDFSDKEGIKAKFENGVLNLDIPKKSPKPVKEIEVN